ncbi:MAG: hypothetical protein ACXAEF_16560 [Candidatus Thorarchaeota archaeon]
MIRLNLDGLEIWESEFGLYDSDEIIDMRVSREGHIYTQTYQQIIKWNDNGIPLWDIGNEVYWDFGTKMLVLIDGSLLIIQYSNSERSSIITKYTSDGSFEWSKIPSCRYAEDWIQHSVIQSMTQGLDGIIYYLLRTEGFHHGNVVFKMNPDGTYLENYTVAFNEELYNDNDIIEYRDIHVSSNNIVYLLGEKRLNPTWGGWNYSIVIDVYGDEVQFMESFGGSLLTTASATTIIIGAIVGLSIWQKKVK